MKVSLQPNIVILQIYLGWNCFVLILGPFSYSVSLESLFQIFLGVFSRIVFNPTCVTIMITCCQQAHGHCRFFFGTAPMHPTSAGIGAGASTGFSEGATNTPAHGEMHRREPQPNDKDCFCTYKICFCKDCFSFVQVTNGSSLQQKILCPRCCGFGDIPEWNLNSKVCFQGIIRSADSKLRIISLRSRPYSYGLCGGGNAWK